MSLIVFPFKKLFINKRLFYLNVFSFNLRNKTPILNLTKTKEKLKNPTISAIDNVSVMEKKEGIGQKNEENEKNIKNDNKKENLVKKPENLNKKEGMDLINYFIIKEKEVSSKIIRCSSENEIMKIFIKQMNKRSFNKKKLKIFKKAHTLFLNVL